MINIRVILLVFFLIFAYETSFSQVKKQHEYVIFTFELTERGSKDKQLFHWITPVDSIKEKLSFSIFPLYIEEFSKDEFDRCITGYLVDIFTKTVDTNYKFEDTYELQIKELLSLIKNKKTKIQSIKKNWAKGVRKNEMVNVYATTVAGVFCICLQRHISGGNRELLFRALVYMPVSSFSYNEDFWATENGTLVKYADYSFINFTSHLPSYRHGGSRVRAESKVKVYK